MVFQWVNRKFELLFFLVNLHNLRKFWVNRKFKFDFFQIGHPDYTTTLLHYYLGVQFKFKTTRVNRKFKFEFWDGQISHLR